MRDALIVFRVETARKRRSRTFLLATIAGAISIVLVALAPGFFARTMRAGSDAIAVAGPAPLRDRVATALARDYRIADRIATPPAVVDPAYLRAHGDAAALVIVGEERRRLHLTIYARKLTAFGVAPFRDLVPLNVELATGVPAARIAPLVRIARTLHGVGTRFQTSDGATVAHGIALTLVFLLYFAIVVASQTVMSSIAEEKTSRVAELLIATIAPEDLLLGKTLAAAALGLVQIGVWTLSAFAAIPYATSSLVAGLAGSAFHPALRTVPLASVLPPGEIAAFAGFFIVGFLQYATIYAAAASLVSRTEDLGIVTTPVIMPVVIAFFAAQYALVAPDSPGAVAASFVPLLSPFVMFARIAVATVPAWQALLAAGIDVACVAASFVFAGRLYRLGMLSTGRLPSLRQVLAIFRG